jgi:integrase
MLQKKLEEFKSCLLNKGTSENTALAYVSRIKNMGANGPVHQYLFNAYVKDSELKPATVRQTFAAANAWNKFFGHEVKLICGSTSKQTFEPRKRLESNGIIRYSDLVFEPAADPGLSDLIVARNKMMCGFLYYAGLRSGELANLKVTDIDFELNQINIEAQKSRARTIPLNPLLADLICAYQDELCLSDYDEDSKYLLLSFGRNHRFEKLGYGQVRHIVSAVLKDSGFNVACTHDFRRAFVTHMFKSMVTVEEIKSVTGHSSYGEVDHYYVGDKTAAEAILGMV